MNTDLIFNFLKEIKVNNNKEWFEANRSTYQEVRKECEELIRFILDGLTPVDPALTGLAVKDCMFRINRDIRFSPDKTPYKVNIGLVFTGGGKNTGNPSYYVHLEPGDRSFIGGGIYMPSPENLSKIRQEIDYNAVELKKILNDPGFKKYYSGLDGEKLKTSPKGYSSDHPDIDLLRYKHYVVIKDVKDSEVKKKDYPTYVLNAFKAMKPFNDFLRVSIS
jgi:uncharacterized protein (TIGR02453 family)